jgi:hypothetical protein
MIRRTATVASWFTWKDKTSRGTKCPENQSSVRTKCPEGNVWRQKIHLAYFQYVHIKTFKNNTVLNNFEVYFFIYMPKQNLITTLNKKYKYKIA